MGRPPFSKGDEDLFQKKLHIFITLLTCFLSDEDSQPLPPVWHTWHSGLLLGGS
jgi:hypothetical protein